MQQLRLFFAMALLFFLHVSGDNSTHHQEYICCIWPQVGRLTSKAFAKNKRNCCILLDLFHY